MVTWVCPLPQYWKQEVVYLEQVYMNIQRHPHWPAPWATKIFIVSPVLGNDEKS